MTGRAVPFASWTPEEIQAALRAIGGALQGVGVQDPRDDRVEAGDLALHVRRCTTPQEELGVATVRMQRGRGWNR